MRPSTKRLTLEYVKVRFDSKNYNLVSETYKNNRTTLYYICTKHSEKGIQEMTFHEFDGGRICNYCSFEDTTRKTTYNIDIVNEIFARNDYTLLDQKYIGIAKKMQYRCNKHADYIQKIRPIDLINGHGCVYCVGKRNLNIDIVRKEFEDRSYELISDKYINTVEKLKYICREHPEKIREITYTNFHSGQGCKKCGLERVKNGINHYNWQGGITKINCLLRRSIKEWYLDSMRSCNYKCVISGELFEVVHHLYNFSDIAKETLKNCQISSFELVNELDDNQIQKIKNECLKLHFKYGLGVCLTKKLHKQFHHLYGNSNNTKEQFKEFCDSYKKEV